MPAGPGPLGLVYFAAVKLAGYTAVASYFKTRIPGTPVSSWLIGGVRTAIGLGAGFGASWLASQLDLPQAEAGFYLLLVPIRICEWLFLLWLFYRRPEWIWSRSLKLAAAGSFWSYVLDIPAVLSIFVLPGGAWIC